MKYVIVIPDGAADHPLDELDGRTPFEAARTPNIDRLAITGRLGTVATTPPGMPCGSDTCSMSLLGYDPKQHHTGRAPLEAAALGIDLDPADWVFRVNFITVLDGKITDHSAGHIRDEEARRMLAEFTRRVELPNIVLHPGVSYRNIMVDSSGRDWTGLRTTPPHDVPGEPMSKYLPADNENAVILQRIIAESEAIFAGHEINQTRREMGELPATHLWPWGQGRRPDMPSFASRFRLRGAMVTAVDLLAGIAAFIGWDRLDVPGQTSYHDTDYDAAGAYAVQALDDYDIVCVHVESPDEASHAADPDTKVAAIESIDREVVGQVVNALEQRGERWRIMVLPDHYTSCATRKHDPTPVPFLICGHRIRGVLEQPFTEANADGSDLHIDFGHELMEYFLFSGLS